MLLSGGVCVCLCTSFTLNRWRMGTIQNTNCSALRHCFRVPLLACWKESTRAPPWAPESQLRRVSGSKQKFWSLEHDLTKLQSLLT